MKKNQLIDIYTGEDHTNGVLSRIKTLEDLEREWLLWHWSPTQITMHRRHNKIKHIYHPDNNKPYLIAGRILELAFGLGESLYWFLKGGYYMFDCRYVKQFDMIDFNPKLRLVGEILKTSFPDKVGEIMIGDIQQIPQPDGAYDLINACSVLEHLPEDVYWNTLHELFRLTHSGSLVGVYNDMGPGDQHIRVVPVSQTVKEMESIGFIAETEYMFRKP